jgi:hypothetical protein
MVCEEIYQSNKPKKNTLRPKQNKKDIMEKVRVVREIPETKPPTMVRLLDALEKLLND